MDKFRVVGYSEVQILAVTVEGTPMPSLVTTNFSPSLESNIVAAAEHMAEWHRREYGLPLRGQETTRSFERLITEHVSAALSRMRETGSHTSEPTLLQECVRHNLWLRLTASQV